jgi:hypothetical protein
MENFGKKWLPNVGKTPKGKKTVRKEAVKKVAIVTF